MNRTLGKFLSLFIFNKQKKQAFHKKHFKPSAINRAIATLQHQVKSLADDVAELEHWGIDPRKISPARGFDRAVQLLGLEVLKDIDRVCRKHNIRYWLDFGTLLGAMRHVGFVPWDDDVDISMPWEDYQRFKNIPPSEFECSIPHFQTGLWLKVYHKDFFTPWPYSSSDFPIFVDIFPYHNLADSWTRETATQYMLQVATEKVARCDELDNIHGVNASNWEIIDSEFSEKEARLISYSTTSYLFMSLCWPWQLPPRNPPRIARVVDILPLKELEFEGNLFMAPAQPEIWLTCLYGAWWRARIFVPHLTFDDKRPEDLQKLYSHAKRLGAL